MYVCPVYGRNHTTARADAERDTHGCALTRITQTRNRSAHGYGTAGAPLEECHRRGRIRSDVSKSPPSRMGGLLGVRFHRRRAVSGTCRLNAKRRDGPYAIPTHMPLRMPYSAEAERPHNRICIPCDASLGVQAVTGHANRRQPPTIHGLPAHGGRRFTDSDSRLHPCIGRWRRHVRESKEPSSA